MEAAATREMLLDAAERTFRDKGVAHTSLAEVAEAAGMTRGAVYWHFRDKADLFKALCDRVTLPMEAMLANAGCLRPDDPLATVRALAIAGLNRLATDARCHAVFDLLFHKCEFTSELTSVAARQRATDSGCQVNIERLLMHAVEVGQLPPDTDARLAATALNAFVVGLMYQWVQRPSAFDLEHGAPAMIDLFLAGMREAPPRQPPAAPRKRVARRPRTASAR